MSNYMEELTTAWVGWLRHRNAVQEKVVELVRSTDARFGTNEDRRDVELKRLQRSFYRVAIADKLFESGKFAAWSPSQLLLLADEILDKMGYVAGRRGRHSEVRTAHEERLYGTVRVRWSQLLKKARVRAADSRGGDTSHFRFTLPR
jgi:hypothetical protein